MKLFTYNYTVHLRDTDATGVLFFADQFKIVVEVLEAFLKVSGMSLGNILKNESFVLPVVHAEADYLVSLTVGDEVEITLSLGEVGTSSFTLHYALFDRIRKVPAGKVSVVHVAVSRETQKSIPIPSELLALFTSNRIIP